MRVEGAAKLKERRERTVLKAFQADRECFSLFSKVEMRFLFLASGV